MTGEKVEPMTCPLCGLKPKLAIEIGVLAVYCPYCMLHGPQGSKNRIGLWNQRSPSSESVSIDSTHLTKSPCPLCGHLTDSSRKIRHEGLTVRTCPFCGGKPQIEVLYRPKGVSFRIECKQCHARGRVAYTKDSDPNPELIRNLADEWNWRISEIQGASE